jgi:hypothetical protein
MQNKEIKKMAEEFVITANLSWNNLKSSDHNNFYTEFISLEDDEKIFFLAYVQGLIFNIKNRNKKND